MNSGKIIKLISNDYTVLENDDVYVCKSRGNFRYQNIKPLVGDNVLFDKNEKIIKEVLTRRNELVRPPVSNVDQALIVTNVYPQFSSNLLDKLICVIEYNNIVPIICFTKLDLIDDDNKEEIIKVMDYYKKIGYQVYTNDELDKIKNIFEQKITVFTGQTGAGKSTLINKLNPSLELKTDEISKALGRGKHTTRHVELIPLFNGYVADTPGFSDVYLDNMKNEDIRDSFVEFLEYRDGCRYKDCMHNKEDECGVKDKVKSKEILESRYENYLKFIKR